jgi:ribokinase
MTMPQNILVIGSSNTDMVVQTAHFPQPGETVLGGSFLMSPGGKGANQAVAAARLGGQVRFVAKLGCDLFGQQAEQGFKKEGLDTQYLIKTPEFPSGIALITVNQEGENEIVVASGANMELHPSDLPDDLFEDISIVLLQLEIPLDTVRYIINICAKKGIKVVLNPAPALHLDQNLYESIFLITPNETETEILTGIRPDTPDTLRAAARAFRQMGVQNVVITLGSQGVYLFNDQYQEIIPSQKVKAIDTTAAGDVLNGALVTALAANLEWKTACMYACKAAAISVTRPGAQSSAPYQSEIL